jgi:hypothetical protein
LIEEMEPRCVPALADPTHPEHDDLLAWVPEGFDPAAFSAAEADAALAWARKARD